MKINCKKLFSGTILVLLALTFIVRLVGLTMSPPGFFSDEASFGYNAFSIIETGKDEHGFSFPVFFKALGDYKNPIQIYAMAPIVKIFGLSVFSVRLTSALFGIGSILLFICFLNILTKNKRLSLLGGLVLSIMPWHFFFSRIGFEAMSFIFFIILAMVFFAKFIKTKSEGYFLVFCISIIVSFFAYSTARLMLPITALTMAFLWRKEIFKRRVIILILLFSALLFTFLLYYDNIISSVGITDRAGSVSISNFSPSIFSTTGYFISNYINHFSPQFLFQSGDYNLRHSSGVSSMLFTSFAFPLLLGLAYFVKKFRSSKFAKFIIFMIVTFPLASSLTIIEEGAQATRSIHIIPFLAILVTAGIWQLYILFKEKYKLILVLLSTFFFIELSLFYHNYFFVYPIKAASYYNYGLPEAFETALIYDYDQYYISRNISTFGIEMPFFMKYNPASYQNNKVIPYVKYLYAEKLENPEPNSVAIYRAGDNIKHFDNEQLMYTSSCSKRVVKKDFETGKDYYDYESYDTFYVYEYR